MKKVTAKNVEVQVDDPPPPQAKPAAFEPGGERRTVLAPRQVWPLAVPGVRVAMPADVEFAITPDNLEAGVFVFRPALAQDQKPWFEACGQDLAIVDQEYALQAYGDGTAALTGAELVPGTTIYFPSPRYDETGAFSPQNAGLWVVERVRLGRKVAHLRRPGKEPAGTTETVKATAPSDIQTVVASEHSSVLLVGFVSGVFPVVAASPRWLAVRMSTPIPETDGVIFDQVVFAETFLGRCEVQTDQVASVRFNKQAGIVVVPAEAGVEAEMSRYEVRGFVTGLEVENLSTQPMKLRVAYRLGN